MPVENLSQFRTDRIRFVRHRAILTHARVASTLFFSDSRSSTDVLTAQEDGAGRLADPDLLDRAEQLGRILFSMDEDLLVEAAARQREGKSFATVVCARQMEAAIGSCISDLETLAKAAEKEDARGQVIFL